MSLITVNQSSPLPNLGPVREALQKALNEADDVRSPGLQQALQIVEGFSSADDVLDVAWVKRVLAVADLDPAKHEVKSITALRAAQPKLGLGEAQRLVREAAAEQ